VTTGAADTGDPAEAGLDPETLTLLTGSLRELFENELAAADVMAALSDMGWDDVRTIDPRAATTLLFTEHGRALARSRALDDAVLDELGDVLPDPAGRRAVMYPVAGDRTDRAAGGRTLRGVLLAPIDDAHDIVVLPAGAGDSATPFVIPAESVAAVAQPANGFDPGSGWLAVSGVAVEQATPIPAGQPWVRARAVAHRALAIELAAVCESALAMATEHVTSRQQFGRPIGAFQAVRHRLAEAHVEVSAARAAIEAAWSHSGEPDGGAWASRIAKQRAGRAQGLVFRHVLQVFGAVGLTMESDVHRYATRAAALDSLLDDGPTIAEQIGNDLLRGGLPHPVVEI
jgi:Acyl-CoA dehydrogenase, C-terminal domain